MTTRRLRRFDAALLVVAVVAATTTIVFKLGIFCACGGHLGVSLVFSAPLWLVAVVAAMRVAMHLAPPPSALPQARARHGGPSLRATGDALGTALRGNRYLAVALPGMQFIGASLGAMVFLSGGNPATLVMVVLVALRLRAARRLERDELAAALAAATPPRPLSPIV